VGLIHESSNHLEYELSFEWISPVFGRVSSHFGYRYSPIHDTREFHDGVDIAIPIGTALVAPRYGYVIAAGYSASFGRFLRIAHGDGYETFFAHLNDIPLVVGDRVEQGERVAYSGNTGWSTAPHLHFSIFRNGQSVDPLEYVSFSDNCL